ncbi:MFS transporter [Chloroflexota bacterium]
MKNYMNDITSLVRKIYNLKTFNSFHHRNFPLLFLTTISMSVGNFMLMVALGWLILEMTDSPMSLGMIWAVRSSPYMLFGLVAGAVADRVSRKLILITGFIIMMVCSLLMGILITTELLQLWHALLITFLMGIVMTFDTAARASFVIDIVGQEDAMSALSMNAVAMRIMGVVGGGIAGIVIEVYGLDWPFYIMVISYLIGTILLSLIRGVVRVGNPELQSVRENFIEGIKILGKNRIILILAIMAVVCEIFGFSFFVVLPIFARDILNTGAFGLGMLNSVNSVGGLVGVLILASLGNYKYKGRLILGIFLLFGIFLILFGQSPWYWSSLVLMGVVGMMAAGFDAMQHTMLQLNVEEEQRGRAMGIWMLSIGAMPLGSLMIGAVANVIGAQMAVTINGAVLIGLFLIVVAFVPRLRNA